MPERFTEEELEEIRTKLDTLMSEVVAFSEKDEAKEKFEWLRDHGYCHRDMQMPLKQFLKLPKEKRNNTFILVRQFNSIEESNE